MRRILIVKLADLGDVLLCEPAVRSLREAFPDAAIDILVPPSSAGIVELIGHDTSVLTFPKQEFDTAASFLDPHRWIPAVRFGSRLRKSSYDTVVLLHHLTTKWGATKFRALSTATGAEMVVGLDNGRGGFLTHRVTDRGFGTIHEAEYMLDVAVAAGGARVSSAPRIEATGTPYSKTLPDRYIAVFPVTGPFASARTWPTQRYAEVVEELASRGMDSVIVGGDDAISASQVICARVPSAIDLAGQTTLYELATVLRGAVAVVGGDSFIGHFAAALGRPVISIFGPTNSKAWRPLGSDREELASQLVVVRDPMPCAPCVYTGYSLGRPTGCPARTCLANVLTGQVIDATRRVLEATQDG